MFYLLQQKVSESYVYVNVPGEIKRGCKDSEFQFLDRSELKVELGLDYGTEFPDLIMAENYVPLISDKFRKMMDFWGIDNLYYKKIILSMSDFGIEEVYWLALPPRIDCLDPEESFDNGFNVCIKVVIIPERTGNYQIFKLRGGNDELVISEDLRNRIQKEISDHKLQGIVIQKI